LRFVSLEVEVEVEVEVVQSWSSQVETELHPFAAPFLISVRLFNLLNMVNRIWMKHIAVLACIQQLGLGLQRSVQLW